mmetsp:Transcript_9756/g.24086  ORF Transcript_9756/g.24086 Transcript_9756/m.24086 type:complete len:1460 (-) Transcript_9756:986-5365(-)|eukprot:CAMPEP_0178994758 /NCGR_PEP_ID=MMETSP0795-20121207/7449_1 /TAXON_ID=88552 /ORGANISM="Amoebophrya sp., Strain Ameob2" /LENGTH=1459 /DNA_ID=CAMNT_0020686989 /DNA_START=1 /DNA_END=4380 /DNA_ORIENTATION=+
MAPSNVVSLASPEDVPGVMTRGSGCTAAQQPPPRAQENPLQNAAVVQATAAANASSFSADAVETAMRKMPMTRTRPEMTSMPGARVYMANRLETPGFGTRGTKAEDNVDVNKTPLACGIGVKVGESGASSSSASMATSSELPSASANNYTPTSKNKDKVVAVLRPARKINKAASPRAAGTSPGSGSGASDSAKRRRAGPTPSSSSTSGSSSSAALTADASKMKMNLKYRFAPPTTTSSSAAAAPPAVMLYYGDNNTDPAEDPATASGSAEKPSSSSGPRDGPVAEQGAAAGIITKNGLSFPLQNQGGVPFPNGANGSDVDGASSSAAAAAGAAAASLPHIEIIRASKQSIERYLKWEKDNARFLTHKLRDQEARYKTLEEAERAREELRVNLFRFLDPELPQRVDLCKEVQRQFNALAVECSRARAEATRVRELLSESHALYREQENEMSTLRDTFDKQTSIWEQKAVSLATVNSALQAKIDAILAEKQGEMEAKEEQRKTMVEEHRLEVERVTASLNDQIELSKKAFFDEQNANIEKRTQEELKMRNALGEKEGEKLKLLQRIEEKEREIGLLREMVEGEKESYGEKVSEYVVERDALSGELRELKELTEGLEKKNAELELAAENGRKAMELADAERKMLGEDRTRMEAQMRLLEERLAKIEKERLEVEDKLTSLESERATQSKREEDHVRKFADTVTELEQTRVSAAEMKIAEVSHLDQIRAMGSEIEGLTNDKAELQRDFAEFKDAKEKNIADLTVSVNNTERTNEELKELLAKMRLLNNDVTGTLKDRENEIERLKQELDDSRLESKELNAYSKQQAAATARLRGDNLTAQEEFKKAEENLKAEMEATKAGHAEQTSKMREEARKRTEDYAEKIDSLEIEIEKQSALLMKKGEAHLEAQRTWEQAQEKLLGERDAAKAQAERNLAWKQDYEVTRQQLQVAEQQLEDTRSLLAERARTDQMRKSAIGALLQTVQMDQMVGAGSVPPNQTASPPPAPHHAASNSNSNNVGDFIENVNNSAAVDQNTMEYLKASGRRAGGGATAAPYASNQNQQAATNFSKQPQVQVGAGAGAVSASGSTTITPITPGVGVQLHYPETPVAIVSEKAYRARFSSDGGAGKLFLQAGGSSSSSSSCSSATETEEPPRRGQRSPTAAAAAFHFSPVVKREMEMRIAAAVAAHKQQQANTPIPNATLYQSYNNTNVLSASRATSSGELATVDIFAQQQLGGHLHAQVYASPTSPQMRFADQRHLKPLPQAAQRYAQMNHGDGGAGSTTAAIPGHLHHYSPSGGGRPSFDSIQQHQRQPRAGLSPARTQEAGVHDPGSYHRPRAQTYDQVQQDETYDRNISKAISEAETIITYRGVEHNSSSSAQHLPARGPPQGGQGHDLTSDMEDAPPRRVSTSNLLSGNSATGGVDTALLTKLRQERRESIERAIREQQGIFNGAPLEPPGSFLDWFTG